MSFTIFFDSGVLVEGLVSFNSFAGSPTLKSASNMGS
ncbi:unnamed protein product [Ectocarpus sp. CCAP 1310/34]|nr:unnamed protein product [Ectocarpus sp. CCAP 1310/34]